MRRGAIGGATFKEDVPEAVALVSGGYGGGAARLCGAARAVAVARGGGGWPATDAPVDGDSSAPSAGRRGAGLCAGGGGAGAGGLSGWDTRTTGPATLGRMSAVDAAWGGDLAKGGGALGRGLGQAGLGGDGWAVEPDEPVFLQPGGSHGGFGGEAGELAVDGGAAGGGGSGPAGGAGQFGDSLARIMAIMRRRRGCWIGRWR